MLLRPHSGSSSPQSVRKQWKLPLLPSITLLPTSRPEIINVSDKFPHLLNRVCRYCLLIPTETGHYGKCCGCGRMEQSKSLLFDKQHEDTLEEKFQLNDNKILCTPLCIIKHPPPQSSPTSQETLLFTQSSPKN